jgi:hypothetical protein
MSTFATREGGGSQMENFTHTRLYRWLVVPGIIPLFVLLFSVPLFLDTVREPVVVEMEEIHASGWPDLRYVTVVGEVAPSGIVVDRYGSAATGPLVSRYVPIVERGSGRRTGFRLVATNFSQWPIEEGRTRFTGRLDYIDRSEQRHAGLEPYFDPQHTPRFAGAPKILFVDYDPAEEARWRLIIAGILFAVLFGISFFVYDVLKVDGGEGASDGPAADEAR